jgi:predicted MarR family transcription regulator
MSTFSNTDTGNKTADPYRAANLDDASVSDKVEGLSKFVSDSKFGMMTTRDTVGKLVSRCMAVAAKVSFMALLLSRRTREKLR